MGLFADAINKVSGMTPNAPAPSAQEAAYLEALVLSVASDGEVDDADLATLVDAVGELSTFRAMSDADLEQRLNTSLDKLEAEGWDNRLSALAASLPAEADRKTAFKLATAVQYADGEIGEDEESFTSELATAFGFSDAVAQQLIDEVEAQLGIASA